MAKQKKKRTKQYSGTGSSYARPTVTKISAEDRSKASQWWYENKKKAKIFFIIFAVLAFGTLIVYEIVRLITG